MDSPNIVYRYYTNPAFCAQSEVVFSQQTPCVSPKIVPSNLSPEKHRVPPLGANSPRKNTLPRQRNNNRVRTDISDNPLHMNGFRSDESPPELPPKPAKFLSRNNSNASSKFHRQSSMVIIKRRGAPRVRTKSEEIEMRHKNVPKHRYEEIPDDFDYSPTKKRIVESETDEYNVDGPDETEFKEVPTEIVKTVNGKTLRYAIIQSDDEEFESTKNVSFKRNVITKEDSLIATQKLHELLSTPKKSSMKSYASSPNMMKIISPQSRKLPPTPDRICSTPKEYTPSRSMANLTMESSPRSKSFISPISPKAQQKLQYDLEGSKMNITINPSFIARSCIEKLERSNSRSPEKKFRSKEQRSTAIIMPRLAEVQREESLSSDLTYKSWVDHFKYVNGSNASLAIAAIMMALSGALTASLAFYMIYTHGRLYYLDMAVMSGFISSVLGMLGFRSRRYQLLPNRNYVSGYIILSFFSLMSTCCLLTIMIKQPLIGTPLNDITTGAVCAISILSLFVSSIGLLGSYCCRHPPPDNRVANSRFVW